MHARARGWSPRRPPRRSSRLLFLLRAHSALVSLLPAAAARALCRARRCESLVPPLARAPARTPPVCQLSRSNVPTSIAALRQGAACRGANCGGLLSACLGVSVSDECADLAARRARRCCAGARHEATNVRLRHLFRMRFCSAKHARVPRLPRHIAHHSLSRARALSLSLSLSLRAPHLSPP